MAWEFWIDRGGTFTDIVAQDPEGSLHTHKLLSENPEQYKDAAVQGISNILGTLAIDQANIGVVKMGTTVATNALLERKGAAVLLMITEGFGDLLEIGYQTRPDLFSTYIKRPEPLYQSVVEVTERLNAKGQVLIPVDLVRARRAMQVARAEGVQSIAIALLHAYLNPEHEKQLAALAIELGFAQISTSHEVSGLAKLVGRGDTTVVDAYLSPILEHYVDQVANALRLGQNCKALMFMQSNGGLTDAQKFQGKDAILSGPAGGIVGMVQTGQQAGFDRLIGFDMGGTSTDVSHFSGKFERNFETEVAGVRMRAPMMDIHTVAAGGGSICSYRDGRFQVGPDSAGADPGPASYRRGGPLTVTDCNLLLGSLSTNYFPSVFGVFGNLPLDDEAAHEKIKELALQHDLRGSIEDMAMGFLKIAVQNMANAIKKISVERGHDITSYTLQSFGGAGGQHACLVAEALGMSRVMIHPFAGVLSAYGMGLADVRSLREGQLDCDLEDDARVKATLDILYADVVDELAGQGIENPRTEIRAHLRYEGSHQALEVSYGAVEQMSLDFEAAHLARFGFSSPDRKLQFEMLSVEAIGEIADVSNPIQTFGDGAPIGCGQIYRGTWHEIQIYDRSELRNNQVIKGPAIIMETTGTNVVEPGWEARRDGYGNLIIEHIAHASRDLASTEADPILLEVMSNRFMSIADQMGATLANTSWSVNIKERFDFSCAIFDEYGDLVANAPHVPVHLGSMSESIKTVMQQNTGIGEGDSYMLNSPYNGGTHLPDVTVVTPVFVKGEVAFWLGSRGHHADIGGRTPGSAPPDSTNIEEEGVLIDNVKLVEAGRLCEGKVIKILSSGRYPCRNISQNIADLKAQVAANETGRRELLKMASVYGQSAVTAYMAHVQDNAEESVREVIATLKDGNFVYKMDTGQQVKVAITVDRNTRSAQVDFTGTSAQHEGNYNAPLAVSRAVVLYVFRLMVGKKIPLNEGCLKPLNIIVPEFSMLNPQYPAAVIAGNTEVSQAACNSLIGALGIMACSQGTMNNFVWGNEVFQNYETIAGGTGAGPNYNGCDAVQTHMTNTRMTDPEILENRFPVLLRTFSIRRGSGGLGRYRGGHGAVRRLEFLTDVTVTTLSSHRQIPPFGLAGGGDGATGENWAELPDGTKVNLMGNDEIELPAGSIFGMCTPGGGAWGSN
ncbi:MAG: hydantoinase B/oxoprolinase family protein [Planktomarina sp.]|nr:hydantoinase B/oxoprolinase family protein [Planktomarina sp.]